MTKIDPELELALRDRSDKERKEYTGMFSSKWVEHAATWFLYAVGAIIVGLVVNALVPQIHQLFPLIP